MKKQTDIAKNQYQVLDKINESDEKNDEMNYKPTLRKYNRSNLSYNNKYSFHEYNNTKKFNGLSFESKYAVLVLFYQDLNKFSGVEPRKGRTKEKQILCIKKLQNYIMSF